MSRSELETISANETNSPEADMPKVDMTVKGNLSVYYHTHWDREWYLPFRSYQLRLTDVVDAILDRLDRQILPCFMLDGQTVILEDYLELRPENRERLRRYTQNGQISIGPWYVMPDEFLVGGESLIRNLALGIRESRAWGCERFTGYLPDTFGHSADMPTLLRQCGIDSAVVWRGINPGKSLFLWEGPAGEAVKTLHLTDGYFQMMLQDWTATEAQKLEAAHGLVQKLASGKTTKVPALMPIGGDHLGPLPEAAHRILRQAYPNLHETTPDHYMADVTLPDDCGTVQGELTDHTGSFLLPGVYSSRMYLKQANRTLEHLLSRKLEPLLAMAQGLLPNHSIRYPVQEVDLAWKTLILNHPHDSICGCSVDEVHRENEVRFDQVEQLGKELLHRTVQVFRQTLGGVEQWVVFNTGEYAYTGVVPVTEDVLMAEEPSFLTQRQSETTVLQDEFLHDSQRIPLSHLTKTRRIGWIWAEEVPPLGYAVLNRQEALRTLPSQSVSVSPSRLENGKLQVEVAPDGTITVMDCATNRVFENLLRFEDRRDQGDSYNSGPVPGSEPEIAKLAGSRVTLAGPLVGVLELTHHFRGSDLRLVTQVRLDAGSDCLVFETTFVNRASQHKLQAVFNTGKPVREVMAETHLGVVHRRYDPEYRELDFVPVEKMKELKTNTGPVQRFFGSNGQGWITEGLCEYEVYQNTIGVTLMRAFGALSSADTGVRGAQAGPPFETPEGQCLDRAFRCRYAWTPTDEASRLFDSASRFYGNVWGVTGCGNAATSHSQAGLLKLENPVLALSACYWLPGKGLIVRLLNPQDRPVKTSVQTGFSYRRIMEINFLEAPQRELSGASEVTVEARHVKTLLFEV